MLLITQAPQTGVNGDAGASYAILKHHMLVQRSACLLLLINPHGTVFI